VSVGVSAMVLWYGLLSGWLISIIALLITCWWQKQDPGPEPIAALVVCMATFIGTSIGLIVQFFNTDSALNKRNLRRAGDRQILQEVMLRIEKELPNLRKIKPGKKYNSEAHRKAVEVYSFELIAEQIEKIKSWWRYGSLAKKILVEIRRNAALPALGKDASKIIPMLETLRNKIEKELKSIVAPPKA
jgi:hypothetical protein